MTRSTTDRACDIVPRLRRGDRPRAPNDPEDPQFGTAWANDHLPSTCEMPLGGIKVLGCGEGMSVYALEEHSQIKLITTDLTY